MRVREGPHPEAQPIFHPVIGSTALDSSFSCACPLVTLPQGEGLPRARKKSRLRGGGGPPAEADFFFRLPASPRGRPHLSASLRGGPPLQGGTGVDPPDDDHCLAAVTAHSRPHHDSEIGSAGGGVL